MRSARSLHVIMTANAAWNVWNFRRAVASSLLADGHRVTVLAPLDDSTPALEGLGCGFIPLAIDPKGMNPIADVRLMSRFRKVFRETRPDVTLSYTIKNNVYGALAARATRTPFIPNVSGLGTAFLSNGVLQRVAEGLYRTSFRSTPVVFFQNAEDRGLFLEKRLIGKDQGRLLPGSGIDLAHFAAQPCPAADEPPIFLMIARLLRDKGVVEFVEAARRLKRQHPHVRFQLLGATDAANRTAIDARTVAAWQEEGIISYLGTAPDVRPMIAAAHCIVLPSYREGAPRTLIEASSMARPVIATDVPGCRSVVAHGVTGLLCKPRDADSLASAMQQFLNLTHEARSAMGCAGRDRMERHFDEAHVVSSYREAIAAVTGRRDR
jgi:glycosyltransferase involved in cell wall biosynthesis